MAGSVNKVILVGRLGADPKVATMNNGGKVVTLSVATGDSWKDKTTGEKRERTEWHRVVIFGSAQSDGLAGVAEQYLRKGNQVYLEGQLQTRKWQDKDGNKRQGTKIHCRQVDVLADPGNHRPKPSQPAAPEYEEEPPF